MSDNKTFEGELCIGRVSASHGNDYVEIRVSDKSSHCQFIEVEISLEEFSKALFAMSGRPCSYQIRGVKYLGKQYKNAKVDLKDEKELDKWLKNNPGWFARRDDLRNHHLRNHKAGTYTVHVWTYVDSDASSEQED